MKGMKIVRKITEEDGRKFLAIATAMVDEEVISDDENKKVIAILSARDMTIGARLSRNKYIGIGVIIGIVATTGYIKYKKSRKDKQEEIEEV